MSKQAHNPATIWERNLRSSPPPARPAYRSPVRPETRSSAIRSQTSPVGPQTRRRTVRPPWNTVTTVNAEHKWGRGRPLPARATELPKKPRDGVVYPGWDNQWHQYPCNNPSRNRPDEASPEHWSYAMQRRLMDESMVRGSPSERPHAHPGFVNYDPARPLPQAQRKPVTVSKPKKRFDPSSPNAPSLVQVAAPTAKAPPPAPAPAPAPVSAPMYSAPPAATSTESNLPSEDHIQRAEDEWVAATRDHDSLAQQLTQGMNQLDPDEREFVQDLVLQKGQALEERRQALAGLIQSHVHTLMGVKSKNEAEARKLQTAAAAMSGEDRDDMEWLAGACQGKAEEASARIQQLSDHPALRTSSAVTNAPPSNPYGAPAPASAYPSNPYQSNTATANDLDLDISDDEGPGPSIDTLRRAENSILELP